MSEWISVEDRLPENNVAVIAYQSPFVFPSVRVIDDIWIALDEENDEWHDPTTRKVTHWQPLPKAPEIKL